METRTSQDNVTPRDPISDARDQFVSADRRVEQGGVALPEPVPERIGPYRVIHRLGHGGMGSVFLAIHSEDQFKKRVAIKLIKRGMDTEEILRRFDLERQVLSALTHANIARLLGAGSSGDGRPYFVLEYIEGLPIDQYCDSNNLPIVERVQLFRKICSAIHYAHQNLIVHRDLKPGNILVTREGEPKLLDFGIAKLLNPDLFNVTLATGPEVRLMTPEYASPEQVQGQPISTASDVYSLGILLYELLTGHRPYQIKTRVQQEILRIICEVEPERPSTAIGWSEEVRTSDGTVRMVTPDDVAKKREGQFEKLRRRLKGDLDNILLKALQKAPRRRYASAEQFSEDLQRYLDGLPVTAQPDTWVYRASKFVRRHRIGVATATTVAILLVAGITGTTWQWRRAVAAEAIASDRARQFEALIDSFLAKLRGELARTEGAVAARKALAETALAAVDDFAGRADSSPQVLRRVADAYILVGDVYGGIRSGNEGDTENAEAAYQKALDIRTKLQGDDPDNKEAAAEVAVSHIKLADTLQSDPSNSRRHLQAAVEISRDLRARYSNDLRIDRLLANALLSLSDTLDRTGQDAEAARALLESVDIRKSLFIKEPREESIRRDYTVGLSRLGAYLEKEGRFSDAIAEYRKALEVREATLKQEVNARTKRDVAITREKLGNALLRSNELAAGCAELKLARTLIHELSKADPNDSRLRQDLDRIQVASKPCEF